VEAVVLKTITPIRADMPRLGGRKLHFVIQEQLLAHNITMGRDRFFNLLGKYGLLIRKRKRSNPITTNSDHPFFKYPNLIRDLEPNAPNQLWVSDMTFVPTATGSCFLNLVTDAYSRKIVGWCLWRNMRADGTVQALKMALEGLEGPKSKGLIHHSDRGLQYCCREYTNTLVASQVTISMTENGDPYENAIAERVNGILKTEFGIATSFKNYDEAKQGIQTAINTYNCRRPHASCNYLTPQQAHNISGKLKSKWKKSNKRKDDPSDFRQEVVPFP
jgi:transposase InsO family protein